MCERVVGAMALPVRVVNCGTTVGDRESAGASRRRRRRRRRPRGLWRPKLLTLSRHDFFMVECRNSLAPISTAIGFFRNMWLVGCLGALIALVDSLLQRVPK